MRLADQRPGQRHPLPLAAGQLARPAVEQVADAEQVGRPARLAVALVPLGILAARSGNTMFAYTVLCG